MYHSITFKNKNGTSRNTWTNWHLIPSSRPLVAPPTVVEKFVDIPGRDGPLDVTTLLTGSPVLGSRKGAWEFYVMHDKWSDWPTAYSTILKFLHGKEMYVILEDDPDYQYHGRVKVGGWQSPKDYSTITIEYTLDPNKEGLVEGANFTL